MHNVSDQDLNKQIAATVFGYTVSGGMILEPKPYIDGAYIGRDVPDYCNNMRHAWYIVSKLSQSGVSVRLSNKSFNDQYWWVYLDGVFGNVTVQESSAARAICSAALQYLQKRGDFA